MRMPKIEQKTNDKFWNFVTDSNKAPELILYGPISSRQSWYDDVITPNLFSKELSALGDVPEIVVRINSGGGDVFAANAIFTRLKDHSAKITVKIDGWAASAATIIAMAGDVIKIAKNGVFMIHNPSMTVWDTFTAVDFEKMAAELKVIAQSIINTYKLKTGLEASEIEKFMNAETWWTGDEAVENGFCDELMFEDVNVAVENKSKIIVNSIPMDLTNFKQVPLKITQIPKNINNQNEVLTNNIKQEREPMAETTIRTVDELKLAYPNIYQEVWNQATTAERNRIKQIEDMAQGCYEDIVFKAKFETPLSVEQTAMQIVAEQARQKTQYLNSRNADVSDSNINNVESDNYETSTNKSNPFDSIIDSMTF